MENKLKQKLLKKVLMELLQLKYKIVTEKVQTPKLDYHVPQKQLKKQLKKQQQKKVHVRMVIIQTVKDCVLWFKSKKKKKQPSLHLQKKKPCMIQEKFWKMMKGFYKYLDSVKMVLKKLLMLLMMILMMPLMMPLLMPLLMVLMVLLIMVLLHHVKVTIVLLLHVKVTIVLLLKKETVLLELLQLKMMMTKLSQYLKKMDKEEGKFSVQTLIKEVITL